MDYKAIYDRLIEFRKNNKPVGYTENHHIVMKSLGGDDSSENLVELTGREHYLVHLLLYRFNPCSQTVHACNMMAMRCEERGIRYIKNSRMYEAIRIHHAKLVSKRMKQFSGSKNSQFDTMWICNVGLEENKKINKYELIPEGWIKGRNKWKMPKNIVLPEKKCIKCGKIFRGRGLNCSHSCSNSRPMSEEQKKKISENYSNKPRPWRKGLKYNKSGCRP